MTKFRQIRQAIFLATILLLLQHEALACGGQGTLTTDVNGALIGQNWTVALNARANAAYFVFLSLLPAQAQIPGVGEVCLDLGSAVLYGVGTTDAAGNAASTLPIPNNLSFLSLTLYAQVFVVDAAAPNGWAISQRVISPIKSLSLKKQGLQFVGANEMALAPSDLLVHNPGLSTVYKLDSSNTISTAFNFSGGLALDATHFSSGPNMFFISRNNQIQGNLYPNPPNLIFDNYDFWLASGNLSDRVTKMAINQNTQTVILFDAVTHNLFYITNLFNIDPILDLVLIGGPHDITELEASPLNGDYFFYDQVMGSIFQGNTVDVSRADILSYTHSVSVDVKALGSTGLAKPYFYDRASGRLMTADNQNQMTTLATDTQIRAVTGGSNVLIEDMIFNAASGSFYILDSFSGVVLELKL